MNHERDLTRLEHLLGLADRWMAVMHTSGAEHDRLHREICEVYGETTHVFDDVVGRQSIPVPNTGSGLSFYPNFFEAGFLSGRSFHTHQGRAELLKVIGTLKRRPTATSVQGVASTWTIIHPAVVVASKDRFDAGQYADAAEAAMKAVNARVKRVWTANGHPEKDGKPLMLSAFSVNSPAIRLGDLSTESGRNIQEGYMHLFAGAMQGVRNPKAHDIVTISAERSLHFLVLASLLMSTLDEVGAA